MVHLIFSEEQIKVWKIDERLLVNDNFIIVLSRSIVSTLCDPTDCSPPGSSVHGIFPAKILEWVAFPPPGMSSWIDVYSIDVIHTVNYK